MSDPTTERVMAVQNQLRIRLAELGFSGLEANNVMHHLAEVVVLGKHLADDSLPLFLELSSAHKEALANVVAHMKWDLDQIKDAIQDMEPDIVELMKFLRQ